MQGEFKLCKDHMKLLNYSSVQNEVWQNYVCSECNVKIVEFTALQESAIKRRLELMEGLQNKYLLFNDHLQNIQEMWQGQQQTLPEAYLLLPPLLDSIKSKIENLKQTKIDTLEQVHALEMLMAEIKDEYKWQVNEFKTKIRAYEVIIKKTNEITDSSKIVNAEQKSKILYQKIQSNWK